MLRGRATGAQYAAVALRFLEAANGQGAVEIIGWNASESMEGPPCLATFAYNLHGVRHTAVFKFWPDVPARLATSGTEADNIGDLVDMAGLNGTWNPTQAQLEVATIIRLANGRLAEDAYVDREMEGEIILRRRHCVAGNLDYSPPAAAPLVRMMRRAGIRRLRCEGDANWIFDVPRRGLPQPPYLPTS